MRVLYGNGLPDSKLILVEEQPGITRIAPGLPFVGPAGRVLDQALELAGIERRTAYGNGGHKRSLATVFRQGRHGFATANRSCRYQVR